MFLIIFTTSLTMICLYMKTTSNVRSAMRELSSLLMTMGTFISLIPRYSLIWIEIRKSRFQIRYSLIGTSQLNRKFVSLTNRIVSVENSLVALKLKQSNFLPQNGG